MNWNTTEKGKRFYEYIDSILNGREVVINSEFEHDIDEMSRNYKLSRTVLLKFLHENLKTS